MSARDFQRLCKIDEEIISLRIAYERERQHELMINKHTLLLSRGIQYKIDAAMRARKALAALMKNAPTARKTHEAELKNRKDKLEDAELELKELIKHQAGCAAALVTNENDSTRLAFKESEYEVRRQKIRIAALDRSVRNYASREVHIPQRRTYARDLETNKTVEEIEIPETAKELKTAEEKIYVNPLENDSRWNVNPMHNPGLDLLYKRPEPTNDGGWGNKAAEYTPPPQKSKVVI